MTVIEIGVIGGIIATGLVVWLFVMWIRKEQFATLEKRIVFIQERAQAAEQMSKDLQGRSRTADWQPIETAPKDGTEILAYEETPLRHEGYIHLISYCTYPPYMDLEPCGDNGLYRKVEKRKDGGFWFDRHTGSHAYPLYWLALPEPPALDGSKRAPSVPPC